MLDSRPKGRGFEPHRRHCVVSLSKSINPSLVLVQPRKTLPFITERLLTGRKESNQTNKTIPLVFIFCSAMMQIQPNVNVAHSATELPRSFQKVDAERVTVCVFKDL